MLLLYLLQILLPGSDIFGSRGELHLLWLMVEDDEIPVHEVEAIEPVASVLRVHDIFVDDIGCALCGIGGAGSYLPEWTVLAEEIEEGGSVDVVGQVLDEEDAIGFWGQLVVSRHIGPLLVICLDLSTERRG